MRVCGREQHNQLMVVSGVGHFTRLEYLCVDDNQIVKLASLATCTALVELYARRNRIRRVEDVDVSVSGLAAAWLCLHGLHTQPWVSGVFFRVGLGLMS
jgi:hypothetical protein